MNGNISFWINAIEYQMSDNKSKEINKLNNIYD